MNFVNLSSASFYDNLFIRALARFDFNVTHATYPNVNSSSIYRCNELDSPSIRLQCWVKVVYIWLYRSSIRLCCQLDSHLMPHDSYFLWDKAKLIKTTILNGDYLAVVISLDAVIISQFYWIQSLICSSIRWHYITLWSWSLSRSPMDVYFLQLFLISVVVVMGTWSIHVLT